MINKDYQITMIRIIKKSSNWENLGNQGSDNF